MTLSIESNKAVNPLEHLVPVLACPHDGGGVSVEGGVLSCTVCAAQYPVVEGVPCMLPTSGEGGGNEPSVGKLWKDAIESLDTGYVMKFDWSAVKTLNRNFVWNSLVRRYVASESVFVEAGIGDGNMLLTVVRHVRMTVGLDIVARSLRQSLANLHALSDHVSDCGSFYCVQCDLESSCVAPGSVDVVYSDGVIEHWLDREARREILRSMASMVRPGGHVIALVPHGLHPFMDSWKRLQYPGYFGEHSVPFHEYGLVDLREDVVAAGLDVVEARGLMPWQSLNIWPRRSWMQPVIRICSRLIPLPGFLRDRYGVLLAIVGKKRE